MSGSLVLWLEDQYWIKNYAPLIVKAQALIPERMPKALEELQRLSNTDNCKYNRTNLRVNHTSWNRDYILDICP